jgi:hypothetical protein
MNPDMKHVREAAFKKIMGAIDMPDDGSPDYDEWLFNKTWYAALDAIENAPTAKDCICDGVRQYGREVSLPTDAMSSVYAPTDRLVSLEKCARAAFTWRDQGRPESEWLTWDRLSENRKKPWLIKAKAVLDAAGVPYGD